MSGAFTVKRIEVFGNPVFNDNEDVVKLNGIAYDMSKQKLMELQYIAYHDRLANRTMLFNRCLLKRVRHGCEYFKLTV